MKTRVNTVGGITLVEVLVVLGVLGVMAVLLLPMIAKRYARSPRVSCVYELKQIGMASRSWALDHGEQFPWQVSTNSGGTLELANIAPLWIHYAVLSNELTTPNVLICPADLSRTAAADFSSLSNSNVSYFLGLDSDEGLSRMVLAGDSVITTNGVELAAGFFELTTNSLPGWSPNRHYDAGNIAMADGRVQQFSAEGLRAYLLANPQTNRLAIP